MKFSILFVSLCLLMESSAFANTAPCCVGEHGPDTFQKTIKDAEIIDLEGQIKKILWDRRSRGQGGSYFTMEVNKAVYTVLISPISFLEENGIFLSPEENVTVVGYRFPSADSRTIIAKELTWGERTVVLRNKEGFPVWRYQRKSKR